MDALKYDKTKATNVLERMGQLYKLEQDMRDEGLTWEQRTQRRQQEALPVLHEIKKWMDENVQKVLPKSPLGQAIAYTLPRWDGLCAYAQHGQVEIDNNLVENAIRPMAIGRKNYLFAGSHEAAEMTAAMYSFMSTCKKNKVNELEWLTDVMARTQSINHKDLHQLLPNNWAKHKRGEKACLWGGRTDTFNSNSYLVLKFSDDETFILLISFSFINSHFLFL
ncbi:IS66 family transposase [Cryomorpha ignava]|uniref:IS66 family transposase n=1 Tax=Cryomorpha ignava TaxID=101383 RepID=A0A7K3WY77_9FLAO|nr:transposase [Cryomorpha ignava]NEN25605.1 IS66 family transposase [Cryomorpha ignava]